MRLNAPVRSKPIHTFEGAVAQRVNPELQLRRLVMAHMLWEDQFYIDGQSSAGLVAATIPKVSPEKVAAIAVEAREKQKLRHVPLLIVREMARLESHRHLVADTLERVIQRPDELAEYVAIYWKDGKEYLSNQSKKGLARAFAKFSPYSIAKYNRDAAVKLRDVMFLVHAKAGPDRERGKLYADLVNKSFYPEATKSAGFHVRDEYDLNGGKPHLETPDTWEVELSAGKGEGKRESWERLLREQKLGALALLRNLRNMKDAGVPEDLVRGALQELDPARVLPFRFIAAARHAPTLEDVLEAAMFRCLENHERLPGKTALVVDNSGSMYGTKVSARSDMDRSDAACALAILVREVCEKVVVIGFGSEAAVIPGRRGFALADAIKRGPGGGTFTDNALALAESEGYDRCIVITDEQSHQAIRPPIGKGYVINVASYQNGIGYGPWTHIDGWSEAVLDWIRLTES